MTAPPGRDVDAMKTFALVAFLICGCERLTGSSADSDRVTKLEARVTALEEQAKEKVEAKTTQRREMAVCLDDAEKTYWEYVKLNGRKKDKPAADGSDTWQAPVAVFDQASKLKQNAIEECRVLYGRQ